MPVIGESGFVAITGFPVAPESRPSRGRHFSAITDR
jgi:hypothetical protein